MNRFRIFALLILWIPNAVFAQTATQAEPTKTLLILGDSLSAAYQMDEKQGWVALLQEKLKQEHPNWQVKNASTAGDTTGNGLNRLPPLLENPPDILLIELGANDGMQAKPFEYTKNNLVQIIQLAKAQKVQVFLTEMHVPPNFGAAFGKGFNAIFHQVAAQENIPLVPFFLDKINTNPDLVQADGLHPKATAQPMIMESIYTALKQHLD